MKYPRNHRQAPAAAYLTIELENKFETTELIFKDKSQSENNQCHGSLFLIGICFLI